VGEWEDMRLDFEGAKRDETPGVLDLLRGKVTFKNKKIKV
jgi:hypothetical protein